MKVRASLSVLSVAISLGIGAGCGDNGAGGGTDAGTSTSSTGGAVTDPTSESVGGSGSTTSSAETTDATSSSSTQGSESSADESTTSTGGVEATTLRELADSLDMRIGAAIKPFELTNDRAYAEVIAAEFNQITPEFSAKWGQLQPSSADEWDFDSFDLLVDTAVANDQEFKGHTLVWYFDVPVWAEALGAAELQAALDAHIEMTVSRYADRIWAWDVVNEAIADGLTGNEAPPDRLRDNIFVQRLGPGYIGDAFRRAREADEDALLVYNDYGIIEPNAKSDAVYDLMVQLIGEGVPVDAVGFQGHLSVERYPGPDVIRANIQRFAALGLEVHISELDVATRNVGGAPEDRLEAQRLAYQSVVQVCATEPACTTVSLWGVSDDYSWLNSEESPDIPLIFDADKARKPAYDGVWAGLLGEGTVEGANVVVNGDCEDGDANWGTLGGALTIADGLGLGGTFGARVSDRSEVWMGPSQALPGPFAGMSSWVFRSQVRVSGGTQRIGQVLRVGEGDDAQFLGVGSTASTTAFTTLSWVYTVSDGGFPPEVLMYIEGPEPGIDLFVDDVSVARLSR